MQEQHQQDAGEGIADIDHPTTPTPPKFVFPEHLIGSVAGDLPPQPCESEAPKIPSQGGVPASNVQSDTANDDADDRFHAQSVLFFDREPHPEPVAPDKLFDEMSDLIRRYVILEPEQADAAALWCAHTFFVQHFDVSPLAIIDAPERECAKTLFQGLLAKMCHRPLPAANASPSALFRSVSMWAPTIFFDESDTFFKDKPELQGIVNAGYKRGGFVLRSEPTGGSFEPKIFAVYCPKSLAGIALDRHLPDSTMSRGIRFKMRRKLRHENVERLRHADPHVFTTIVAKLVRLELDYTDHIRSAHLPLPDELSDRDQDNWEALITIASCAGPKWVARATAAALKLSADKSVSTGNELLADVRTAFAKLRTDRIRTVDLIDALCSDTEAAWATYNNGRPLTPRQLSKLLAEYGISPKTVRQGEATPKGYEKAQFADAFGRYLPPPETLPQRRNASPEALRGIGSGVSDGPLADGGEFVSLDRCGVADTRRGGPRVRSDDDF